MCRMARSSGVNPWNFSWPNLSQRLILLDLPIGHAEMRAWPYVVKRCTVMGDVVLWCAVTRHLAVDCLFWLC